MNTNIVVAVQDDGVVTVEVTTGNLVVKFGVDKEGAAQLAGLLATASEA